MGTIVIVDTKAKIKGKTVIRFLNHMSSPIYCNYLFRSDASNGKGEINEVIRCTKS